MTQTADGISCPTCGRSYKWKAELAGKKAKCKCGTTVRFPEAGPAPAAPKELDLLDDPHVGGRSPTKNPDDGEYDLHHPAHQPKAPPVAAAPLAPAPRGRGAALPGVTCTGCGNALQPGAVVCVACGMNQKTGRKLGTAVQRNLPAAGAPASTAKAPGAGLGPFVPWLIAVGVMAVAGAIGGMGVMTEGGEKICQGVAIAGLIIWIIGRLWGLSLATGDNYALRVACRFVPFLGEILIVKAAINSWSDLKLAVITMITGVTVGIMGLVMMVVAAGVHGGGGN